MLRTFLGRVSIGDIEPDPDDEAQDHPGSGKELEQQHGRADRQVDQLYDAVRWGADWRCFARLRV